MISSKGTGLERLQREAFIVLFNGMNDELTNIETAWATLDQELATIADKDFDAITLERIENRNFYLGHRPSLIQAAIDRYPNVSVMAYNAGPDAPDSQDHLNLYRTRLFVEIMVKSPTYTTDEDQFEAERVVNARIQRTTDAANNVILSNRTFNNTVSESGRNPNITISDVFIRKENTSYGNNWLWQGSRLEYEVSKVARLDDSPGSVVREGLAIDQI